MKERSSQSTDNETELSNAIETTAVPSPTRYFSAQTRGSQKINPPVVHTSMERDTFSAHGYDTNQRGQQYVVPGCVMFEEEKEYIDGGDDNGYFNDETIDIEQNDYRMNGSNMCDEDDLVEHQTRPHRDTLDLERSRQLKVVNETEKNQPRRSSISNTMWNWVKSNCPNLVETGTDKITTCIDDCSSDVHANTDVVNINKFQVALDNDDDEDNMVHPYVRNGGSFQLRYFKV